METEKVTFNGELMLTLTSKQDWINRLPQALPKLESHERLVWLDANGNAASIGLDFDRAKKMDSYPIKVYRLKRISMAYDMEIINPKN